MIAKPIFIALTCMFCGCKDQGGNGIRTNAPMQDPYVIRSVDIFKDKLCWYEVSNCPKTDNVYYMDSFRFSDSSGEYEIGDTVYMIVVKKNYER